MTLPQLTIDVACNDCECAFSIDGDSIKRGTAEGLRCPVCGSNVLRVAFEHAQDEWDGTLEETDSHPTDEPGTMREVLRRTGGGRSGINEKCPREDI